MREIKFRSWDDEQKYMAYQGTPDLETIQSFMFHFGDKELMQFTGYKDINGKDIYDGDFLQQKTDACSPHKDCNIDINPLFDHYEIKWDEHVQGWNAFPISSLSKDEFNTAIEQLGGLITWPSKDVLNRSWHFEVIGNIHENAELLPEADA